MKMTPRALAGLTALAATCLAIQLISTGDPVAHRSQPGESEIAAPPQIKSVLAQACYDCHSNETRWPWYAHIAPVSWLVVHDVSLGRKQLNFSEWRLYYPRTQARKLLWMGRVVRERTMPPWSYRMMHPQARLSGAERAMLEQWLESEVSKSQAGRAAR